MVLGWKMPLTQQIVVYDRNIVRLSKRKFLWQYGAIKHTDIVIEEMKYKWWQANYLAKWMLATCTIRSFKERLSNKDITVSYGTVVSMWHFFVTYTSEEKIVFCLCKLCLNPRLLIEPVMAQGKKDNEKTIESITKFFMHSYECPKTSINGAVNANVVTT